MSLYKIIENNQFERIELNETIHLHSTMNRVFAWCFRKQMLFRLFLSKYKAFVMNIHIKQQNNVKQIIYNYDNKYFWLGFEQNAFVKGSNLVTRQALQWCNWDEFLVTKSFALSNMLWRNWCGVRFWFYQNDQIKKQHEVGSIWLENYYLNAQPSYLQQPNNKVMAD